MPIGRTVLGGEPRLAAGQRTRRVTIQQRSATDAKGASGRPVETWTTLAVEYMSRMDLRADERFAQTSQLSAFTDTQWHMPYRADMDPELVNVPKLRRLSYEGRIYDITTATRIGDKQGIELTTLAQVR